jgi:hypothetical protein
MKIIIVMLDTLQIPYIYDADAPNQGAYIGEWGSPQVTVHMEVPEGLDHQCIVAVRDSESGEITLQEDPQKVAAKTDTQWNSVRAQQSDLLYKSDWTCSVVDPPAPILAQRDQWIAYRAALRDVTTQSDPFNIVWPIPPT